MRLCPARILALSLVVAAPASCGEGPGSGRVAGNGRAAAGGSGSGAIVAESVPSYPFRLVNPRVYSIVVYASAGAGEVLLDTVAARDSVRIEVRVGSDPLKLRAVDLDGNELGSEFLALPDLETASSPQDSAAPIRWKLPPSP